MKLSLRRKSQPNDTRYAESEAYTDNEGSYPVVMNPSGRPMGVYQGRAPNPHILYGQNDLTNAPVTFNRFGTRWGDIQLKNGLANGVASGRINRYRGEGWYDVVVPAIPGQDRLYGKTPSAFIPRGGAPSQYQKHYDDTAGSQPLYPGGPGHVMGTELINPGSGG
jgi:hypothetical protein